VQDRIEKAGLTEETERRAMTRVLFLRTLIRTLEKELERELERAWLS
jgi:hypothetical protein